MAPATATGRKNSHYIIVSTCIVDSTQHDFPSTYHNRWYHRRKTCRIRHGELVDWMVNDMMESIANGCPTYWQYNTCNHSSKIGYWHGNHISTTPQHIPDSILTFRHLHTDDVQDKCPQEQEDGQNCTSTWLNGVWVWSISSKTRKVCTYNRLSGATFHIPYLNTHLENSMQLLTDRRKYPVSLPTHMVFRSKQWKMRFL